MCTLPVPGARSAGSRRLVAPPGRLRGRRTGGFRARVGLRARVGRCAPVQRVPLGRTGVIRDAAGPGRVNIMCDSARTERWRPVLARCTRLLPVIGIGALLHAHAVHSHRHRDSQGR